MERRDERKAVYERTFGFPLAAYTKIKQRKVESMILFTVLNNIVKNETSNNNNLFCALALVFSFMYADSWHCICFLFFPGVSLRYRMSVFLKVLVYTQKCEWEDVIGRWEKILLNLVISSIVGHLIIKHTDISSIKPLTWSLHWMKVRISASNAFFFQNDPFLMRIK